MPPECSCCVHEPAGAAPRPAIKTPHERAPQLDEVERSVREVWEAGTTKECRSQLSAKIALANHAILAAHREGYGGASRQAEQ
jgi:hypothetical protein